MSKYSSTNILWGTGLILLLAGLLSSFNTAQTLMDIRTSSKKRLGDTLSIKTLENEAIKRSQAIDIHLKYPAHATGSMIDLIKKEHPTLSPDNIHETTRNILEWQITESEILFENAPFKKVMNLIQTAESTTPPWKLISCEIKPSHANEAGGKTILTFQGISPLSPF